MKRYLTFTAAICGVFLSLGAADRLIVEDFSDVGTWRTWTLQNITPGKWFGADFVLGATPDSSRDDGYAGKLQFDFADASKKGALEFNRAKAFQPEVFADGVEFDADPRGINCSFSFILQDSAGKRFGTETVSLSGKGWKRFRSEIVKRAEGFTPPFKLYRIHFEATGVTGANYILIDDIALTGGVSRARKVTIRPVLSSLAVEPGKQSKLSYRLRSASENALKGTVSYQLFDGKNRSLFQKEYPVSFDAFGSALIDVELPALEVGSYHAILEFVSGKTRSSYTDWIAAFYPNNGRKNDVPMYFGIQDTSIWNCDAENELHGEWMRMAGFDIERLGVTGNRLDNGAVTNFPAFRKYLKANQDNGMISCVSYTEGAPDYVQNQPKYRGSPTKLPEFRKHMDKVFECIKPFSAVRYFEFWNEPDLDFYNGTLDEFLAAMKVVKESRDAVAPQIKITTGGVTIMHPREKKNFSRDMYLKGKGLYDIACFHAHGSLLNYSERQEMVEEWLKEGGIDLPICNTETGDRSGYTVDTIRRHANTLVRKIVYAKSRNTEFYTWFTLQDYWDMDFEADDSFGLVTSDNRPKPAFIVYNELIRQLGNTGRGELLKETGELDVYRFLSTDGKREVLALWPRIGGARQLLSLEGKGEIAVADLFGKKIPVKVEHGFASIPVEEAMYISFPVNAFRFGSPVAAQMRAVGGSAGTESQVLISVKNPFAGPATVELGRSVKQLKAGESAELGVTLKIPADAPNGPYSSEQKVILKSGAERMELTVPVTVNVSYPVVTGKKPAATIMLNTLDRVHEMSFDPNIPRWMGPKDLSCEFAMTREGGKLLLDIRVTDDKHVMTSTPADGWKDDSIQIGFATLDGKFSELTLSGKDGKCAVYAHISPVEKLRGEWNVAGKFTRQGDVSHYEIAVPLTDLGIADKAGTLFRFSFLVNENDGLGRVRWIEWSGGIGRSKNPDEFGWGVLK